MAAELASPSRSKRCVEDGMLRSSDTSGGHFPLAPWFLKYSLKFLTVETPALSGQGQSSPFPDYLSI